MRPIQQSLKLRVIGLILVIFISIFAVSLFSASQLISSSQQAIANQFLQQQVRISEERTLSFFQRELKLIEFGLEKGIYQSWMRQPGDKEKLNAATDDLQTVCRLTNCYGWFINSHETKEGVSFSTRENVIKEDNIGPADLVWYQPIVDSGEKVIIDSTVGSNTKVRTVFLDYVVRENGVILGIIGTWDGLDNVLQELLYREDENAINLIIDEEKKIHTFNEIQPKDEYHNALSVLDDKNWSILLTGTQRSKLSAPDQQQTIQNELFSVKINAETYLAAFRYIEQVKWFAVSLYPQSQLGAGSNLSAVTAVSLCILIVFLGITLLGLNSLIISPLVKLNSVVKSIQKGDYSTRAGKTGLGIIQNLADGIDDMSTKINDQIKTLNTSNKKLQLATKRAEKANEAKSTFLSNMSHEIRTPLNGVFGTLQLIQYRQRDDEARGLVEKALYSAQSLLVIINDILDFSKIEANKLKLEKSSFSFLEILESVISDMDASAINDDISINTIIDDEFVDGWLGDAVRTKQILLNLVSNAAKFTDKGDVTIRVLNKTKHGNSLLCFDVIDTGIGMSQEFQAMLFERFSQADSSHTRKSGGTGLGMAITVNLIRLMDGTISVKSKEAKGTKIHVTLPLTRAEVNPSQTNNTGGYYIPTLSNVNILIAEDNDINQAIIESMLTPTNASLTFVENGKKAVLECESNSYDIVLMDIQMPEMDGEEAFLRIKETKSDLPIVALTANTMEEDISRYKALGFTAHIGKPIIIDTLYATLHNTLNTKAVQQSKLIKQHL